jgi:BirA family biotin operon repressor/biotin-[acetyl-CoA-carboxylase] ligase
MPIEPLSVERILSRLKTQDIGCDIIYRPAVSSTMDVAREEIKNNAVHGSVVIADIQKHGKGRLDRAWISPPGGVYLSIILYPSEELLSFLTMAAGLAVIDCIREVCGIEAAVKWPNDVLVNGKKVAGILAQSGILHSTDYYAVLGIGINADMNLSMQPEISTIATSLSNAIGKPVSRIEVVCSLLENFEKRYAALKSGQSLGKEWREHLVTLGKKVSVKSGQTIFEGIAESVSPDGSLLLRQYDGKLVEISAGDVTLRV